MLTVTAFDHIVPNVRDVEASAAWYAKVLGMERHDSRSPEGAIRTTMRFGRNKINLRPVACRTSTSRSSSRPNRAPRKLR